MRTTVAAFLVAFLVTPAVSDAQVVEWAPPVVEGADCPAEDLGRLERLQLRGSSLLWWVKQDDAPQPLLTTGTPAGGGALGAPDTSVLLRAGDVIPAGPYVGADLGVHYWFGPEQWLGIDARGLFLGRRRGSMFASGDATGQPLLSIPFTDLSAVAPGASFTPVARPGLIAGQVRFDNQLNLWGAEVGLDLPSFEWNGLELSALAGVRYLELEERFTIAQDIGTVGGLSLLRFNGVGIPGTDRLRTTDSFRSLNQFVGGNLVVRALFHATPRLSVGLTAKTAIGSTYQVLRVAGSTTQLTPANGGLTAVSASTNGLFAQPGTAGRRTDSQLSVVPELEARVAWALSDQVEVSLGYGYLYWNHVLRAGRQVPDTINTSSSPSQPSFNGGGPLPPVPPLRSSSVTAHGLNLGLTLRF